MRRRLRGFSLAELIISVAILGTAVVLVVGLFTVMFRTSQKAVDVTSGTVICEGLLTEAANQILNVTGTGGVNPSTQFFQTAYATPTVISSGNYGLNSAQFFYQIYVSDVTLPGLTLSSVQTGGPCNLKRLDATVWWFNNQTSSTFSRQGYGTLMVQQSRLLWPNQEAASL